MPHMCVQILYHLGQHILVQLKGLLAAALARGRMNNSVGSWMVFTAQG